MSERDIRTTIRHLCDDLDQRARAAARRRGSRVVYPLMVGAGLLVATCDDDPGGQDVYGVPTAGPTGTQTGGGTTSGTSTGSGGEAGTGGQGAQAGAGGDPSGGAGGATGGAGGATGGAGGAGG